MRTTLLLALLLCATAAVADAEVRMLIDRTSSGVRISGSTSSTAHEAILRQTADRFFAGQDVEFELTGPVTAPPGWALITDMALRAAAAARRISIELTPSTLSASGVVTDPSAWSAALARVERALPDGMSLDDTVMAVRTDRTHAERCRGLFRQIADQQEIGFVHAGNELGTGAYAGLDALLELAVDCPMLRVTITGHTDASGDEAVNQRLSLERADAVAAYLIEHGLPATHVSTRGAGSSEPLVDVDSAQARRRNRRVEFSVQVR